MRTFYLIALGLVAMAGSAAVQADSPALELTQNTGAADRTLGNGSMGLGQGIERLPERPEVDRSQPEAPRTRSMYDESGHGDNDTDMEHRPRRTLGDRDDD